MHSEGDIRKSVRLLLDKYGEINVTEAKELLHEVLEYDDEDKEMSTLVTKLKFYKE
mgnify:CR=1 FL=1